MKYTLELEDGSTIELTEEQYKAVQTLNNNHKQRIRELESRMAQYENPKNWTRPFNNEGKLINEHALYKPKLKDT